MCPTTAAGAGVPLQHRATFGVTVFLWVSHAVFGGPAVPAPGEERDDGVTQAPGRVLQLPEAVPEERGRGAGLLPVGTISSCLLGAGEMGLGVGWRGDQAKD